MNIFLLYDIFFNEINIERIKKIRTLNELLGLFLVEMVLIPTLPTRATDRAVMENISMSNIKRVFGQKVKVKPPFLIKN